MSEADFSGEMRVLRLDASEYRTPIDVIEGIKSVLGSPEWHGNGIDAFIDSMIYGNINAIEAPYRIEVGGLPSEAREVTEFVALLAWCLLAEQGRDRVLVSLVPA